MNRIIKREKVCHAAKTAQDGVSRRNAKILTLKPFIRSTLKESLLNRSPENIFSEEICIAHSILPEETHFMHFRTVLPVKTYPQRELEQLYDNLNTSGSCFLCKSSGKPRKGVLLVTNTLKQPAHLNNLHCVLPYTINNHKLTCVGNKRKKAKQLSNPTSKWATNTIQTWMHCSTDCFGGCNTFCRASFITWPDVYPGSSKTSPHIEVIWFSWIQQIFSWQQVKLWRPKSSPIPTHVLVSSPGHKGTFIGSSPSLDRGCIVLEWTVTTKSLFSLYSVRAFIWNWMSAHVSYKGYLQIHIINLQQLP